jgi:hypothetical protein
MKARLAVLGTFVAGISALAACTSGGNASLAPVASIPCVVPSGTLVALAYPAPGATHVPDSPGQVVLALSSPLPNTWQVLLELPNGSLGSEGLLNPIAPSAVPTPSATPTFANPTYESSGLTTGLPANTLVTVLLNDQSSSCNQYPPIGSFTTQ